MAPVYPFEARSQPCARLSPCLRSDCSARRAVSRLASTTNAPQRTGDELDDHDLLEDVDWTGGAPGSVTGVEIIRSRLTGITLTGLELADLRLLDVELVECELSGAVLTGARWERVVLRRCRMSGLVAAELQATDVRLDDCKADQAWLRASVLDRCELVDTDLRGADLYGARVTRSAFRRCDLTEVDVSASRLRAGVAPRIHRRPPQGSRGAAGAARSAATSSCRSRCRSWPPAGSPSTTTRPTSSTAMTDAQRRVVSPSRAAHAATSVRDAMPSFDEDVRHVHGRGARGDVEPLGQTGVAEPLGEERGHLPLARRELGGAVRLAAEAEPALDGDELVDPPARATG